MNPKDLARIEIEARRARAQAIADMFRALFHRTPRADVTGARTA